jgi:hypothetical protein
MRSRARLSDSIRQLADAFAAALHNHRFQAIVMIQMYVCGRKYRASRMMLRANEHLRKIRPMVVIDDRESPYSNFVFVGLV